MITQGARDQILDSLDVRAVLTELGIAYEERGYGDLWAPCPLPDHPEKTPSFKISARFGHWHCFGCKRRNGELDGGIVTLIAEVLDLRKAFAVDDDGNDLLDRDKAWAWLAERAGVAVDPVEQIKYGTVSPRMWEPKVTPAAPVPRLQFPEGATFPQEHPEAMEYLHGRGLSDAEIFRYGIRWWPERRRVLIPSRTEGELVNWDARAIDKRCPRCHQERPAAEGEMCPRCGVEREDVRPKTFGAQREAGAQPDWSIGGYDLVPRRAARVIVTEGPFDAWWIERHLHEPTVFIRGSALHERQMRLLSRWPSVVLVPDGDAAGRGLEARATTMLALVADDRVALEDVRVAVLPPGTQPEDLPPAIVRAAIDAARIPQRVDRPTIAPAPLQPKR